MPMSGNSTGYRPITTEPTAPATQKTSPAHTHVFREMRNRQSAVIRGRPSEGVGAAQKQADAEEGGQDDAAPRRGGAHLEPLRPPGPPRLRGDELEMRQRREVDPDDHRPDLLRRPDPVRPP